MTQPTAAQPRLTTALAPAWTAVPFRERPAVEYQHADGRRFRVREPDSLTPRMVHLVAVALREDDSPPGQLVSRFAPDGDTLLVYPAGVSS